MRMFSIGLAAAMLLGVPAMAQETAPDGTKAFGFEPYVGIGGGYHDFDSGTKGVLQSQGSAKGALITGMAGFNIPLWVFVAGMEGNVAKGFSDIDWEYGAAGRFGFRAGESGLFYGKVGYQWVNFAQRADTERDYLQHLPEGHEIFNTMDREGKPLKNRRHES